MKKTTASTYKTAPKPAPATNALTSGANSVSSTCTQLVALLESDVFTELDRQFVKFMMRLAGSDRASYVLAVAMLSRARADGHTCLDLRSVAGSPFPPQLQENTVQITCPDIESWTSELRATSVVGVPGEFKPLILDGAGRLYLHRYWEYEATVASEIKRRACMQVFNPPKKMLTKLLDQFFPTSAETDTHDWQRIAAQVAAQRQLCVISGGPGTGKTWTLVRILGLLIELAGNRPIQIAVAAPTGKAAARVQEEIRKVKMQLECAETTKAQLPDRATTIHRLLGANRDATSFRFNRANPLPFDVVAIDEAGMVDLALMARVVDALAPDAKLILLGDKDQLASVDPGAVLGDICAGLTVDTRIAGPAAPTTMPPHNNQAKTCSSALAECIVQLQKNYRFSPNSQIYKLSKAVNAGDAAAAIKILRDTVPPDEKTVNWVELTDYAELKILLRQKLLSGFADYFSAQTPTDALNALAKFRVLCALREGPLGVMNINRLAEQIFEQAGLITITGTFYLRRPIMITRNDYNLQLFNGDTGTILLTQTDVDANAPTADSKNHTHTIPHRAGGSRAEGQIRSASSKVLASGTAELAWDRLVTSRTDTTLRAFFASANGELRAVLPARLPEHETAYAITVHKSQGSEFDHVLVILPERDVPLLTRELIYTAITRARKSVELWAPEPVLVSAIQRRTTRSSGLRDALWSTA